MFEHLIGLKPSEIVRRHVHCTTDQDVLRGVESMEKGGASVKVQRDQNGMPTGMTIMPGGELKVIKGTCHHPEDKFCGFVIPDWVMTEIDRERKGGKRRTKAETDPLFDAEEPKFEPVIEDNTVNTDDEPQGDDGEPPVCPSCGTVGEIEMADKDGTFLRCTECGVTEFGDKFYEGDEDDDEGGAPIAPSSIADDAPEMPEAIEEPPTTAADLRKMFETIIGR